MQQLFLTIPCLAFSFALSAQVLYTTTFHGGTKGGGTICKLENGKLSAAFNFDTPDGKRPAGKLLQAKDGKLYGLTSEGGKYNAGTLFSYNAATGAYKKLIEFDTANGAFPHGSLIQATDGKLYGTAIRGGKDDNGVIFSYNIHTGVYKKLTDFDDDFGINPPGSLIQASDGKLYGIANGGGTHSLGVIFSFDPRKHVLKKAADFIDSLGFDATGSLIQATNGNLYGMTKSGGKEGAGVIFSLDPVTGLYSVVTDFSGTTASSPMGSLIQAKDGKLYGMTYKGGANDAGVIFSFNPYTGDYTHIKDLDLLTGGNPESGLFEADNGKLYGIGRVDNTSTFSTEQNVVFSIDPSTKTFTVHSFSAPYDVFFRNDFMQASDGKVYGVSSGGFFLNGSIYSFDMSTLVSTKLISFGIDSMGYGPVGSLAKDSGGVLYGVTKNGGANGNGVVFSFNPATHVYKKLRNRSITYRPEAGASPVYAGDGNLYGVNSRGGDDNDGIIFFMNPATGIYTTVMEFTDSITGTEPEEQLIQTTDGKLYGITNRGGTHSLGVIFSFDPSTAAYTKLYDVSDSLAHSNYQTNNYCLTQAADGKLYGISTNGGKYGAGIIFCFDIKTSTCTRLAGLDYNNGYFQYCSGLIQAGDGNLYGTAYRSLTSSVVIFSYNIATQTYKELAEFSGMPADEENDTGARPVGGLAAGADGKLYGIWEHQSSDMDILPGEHYEPGGLYSFDPATATLTRLQNFTSLTGLHPRDTYFTDAPAFAGTNK